MKRHILVSACALLLVANAAKAQVRWGVTTGLSLSQWDGQAVNSLQSLVAVTKGMAQTSMSPGWFIGANAAIPISERVTIEPGLYYTQKGYRFRGDLEVPKLNFLGANVSAQVRSHYIDMPVVMRVEVAKGLSLYACPQISYLAANDLKLGAGLLGINFIHQSIPMTNLFNRWDAAVTGGLAYQFSNGINFNAGYDYGLTRVDKAGAFKSFNRVIKIGIGYRF